jgi:hypothetical protein
MNGTHYEIGGQRYPRVSQILQTVAKPSLEAWRHKVGLAEAEKIGRAARDLGTRIHEASEHLDRDGVVPPEADLLPYLDAYCEWRQAAVAEVVEIERVVWSATLKYAGTLDRVYRMRDGRLLLGDLKSGKTVDGLTRCQLSAYSLALAETAGIHVDGRLVVHLPSDRPGVCRAIEFDDDAGDALTWRALVRVYWWWAQHSADWKVTP